ncbi:MAG: hypothetical protein EA425_16200 [Puniceicoccaceae bacterium]|nr:MAG: hypothetical protein EA425_16200 [Puniceicoccaceae bacterium]
MRTFLTSLLLAGAFFHPLRAAPVVYEGQPVFSGVPYLLAGWNFNNEEDRLAVSHGTGTASTNWDGEFLTGFSGTTLNAFGDDPAGSDLALQNGPELLNEGRWVQFSVSTEGFESIRVTLAAQSSATGMQVIEWSYSVDGETFAPLVTWTSELPTSHVVRELSLADVAEAQDAAELTVRATFSALEEQPAGITGNTRIDNLQIIGFAIDAPTASGLGSASLRSTSGPLFDRPVFAVDATVSMELELTGGTGGADPMAIVEIDLPAGWSGLASSGVFLSGSGFAGASASVSGSTVNITGASLTAEDSGVVSISGLQTPAMVDEANFGRYPIAIRTAPSGSSAEAIAAFPTAVLPVPMSVLRGVDEAGVPEALGLPVAVTGTATIDMGVINPTRFNVFIQDATGGIVLDNINIENFPFGLLQGERSTVFGTVSVFRGLTQLSVASEADMTFPVPAAVPEPIQLTLAEFLEDAEAYEGMLVKITNISRVAGEWPTGFGISGTGVNLEVVDREGNELTVRIVAGVDIADGTFPEPNWPVSIVGVAGQFTLTMNPPFAGGYQIFPRSAADIQPPVPEDGLGRGTVINATSGSPLQGTERLLSTETTTIDVNLFGPANAVLNQIRLTLPAEFSEIPVGYQLSGSALSGASATRDGRSLTITGASLGSGQSGTVRIPGLELPAEAGSYTIQMETALSGGTLTPVVVSPVAFVALSAELSIADVRSFGTGRSVTLPEVIVVDTTDLINSTNWTSFTVTDGSGWALTVFGSNAVIAATLGDAQPGDTLLNLSGVTGASNGLFQLQSPSSDGFVAGPGLPPVPEVTAAQIQDGQPLLQSLQSRVVKLMNVEFIPTGNFAGLANFNVTDGTHIVPVRVATTRLDLVGQPIPVGPVNITGVLSFFNGVQFLVRSLDDIETLVVPIEDPYESWLAGFLSFEELMDETIAAPGADPSRDGLTNLENFVYGGNPLVPSSAARPVVSTEEFDGQDYLSISFTRTLAAEDILIEVKVSTGSLSNWETIWSSTDNPYPSADESVLVTVVDPEPLGQFGERFLIVVLTRP